MSKEGFIKRAKFASFLLVCFVQIIWQATAQQTTLKHLNIVLIVSDDHGKEAVGCYGNKVVKHRTLMRLPKKVFYSPMRLLRLPVAA